MSLYQTDLFETYPAIPGWKGQGTSREAAEGIAPRAPTIRERVLASIRHRPATPEQVADRIGEPVMNVRPRCSELSAKGLIVATEIRGKAMGGRKAVVWRAR